MKTKSISLADFRKNISNIWREVNEKKVKYVVMVHSKAVLEISAPSKDTEVSLDKKTKTKAKKSSKKDEKKTSKKEATPSKSKTTKDKKKKLTKITTKNSPLFIDFIIKILSYFLSACKTTRALFQGKLTNANNGYHLKNRL